MVGRVNVAVVLSSVVRRVLCSSRLEPLPIHPDGVCAGGVVVTWRLTECKKKKTPEVAFASERSDLK